MGIFKNYNEDDIMSKILLLYFGFQHGAISVFFLFSGEELLKLSAFEGMSRILPMNVWGILLLVSAIAFVATALQENKMQYWFMVIAGIPGVITFSLLSMASIELSVNQTNTVNYIIIASIDIIIAILGGVALWLRRVT